MSVFKNNCKNLLKFLSKPTCLTPFITVIDIKIDYGWKWKPKKLPFGNGSSMSSITNPLMLSMQEKSNEIKQIIPRGTNINTKQLFAILKYKKRYG